MMQRRRTIEKGTEKHNLLNENIKEAIRKDMRTYKTKQIQEAVEENSNMKNLRSELATGRTRLTKLKDRHGRITRNPREIPHINEEFYESLYSLSWPNNDNNWAKLG
ncbi:hypothetical protein HHI36_017090 [Cryptolaemus montrouzieri]|uniref:Uncharacterized protein n=1 Tax=Cryptolaemus montrouzieri TaxID=559131 RepID=A0ABD2NM07_9CUCU